jgi:hypothetical protein
MAVPLTRAFVRRVIFEIFDANQQLSSSLADAESEPVKQVNCSTCSWSPHRPLSCPEPEQRYAMPLRLMSMSECLSCINTLLG